MKQPLKRFFFGKILPSLFVISLFSGISFSEEKGFVLDADNVIYQKDNGVIEATGSVEARYKDVSITGKHMVYFKKDSRIIADGGFSLYKDNSTLEGINLDYNMKSQTGSAEGVKILMGSTWIRGKNVKIDPENIDLKDAGFSSCNLDNPHYKISSSNMTFYPKSGWIVEYLGYFWINNIPVFPVPTYVYDTTNSRKNSTPLPDLGSNDVDGFYLHEKIVWRLSSYSYGLLGIDYASKKGLGGGFESNYILNNNNQGNVRINYLGSDGLFGGLTHDLYFGDDVPRDKLRYFLYEVLQNTPRKKYDLALDVSYRERINYERVSMLPMLTLRYIDVPFPFINFQPKIEVSGGSITEESSGISHKIARVKGSMDYLQPLSADSKMLAGLDIFYTLYGTTARWATLLGRIDLTKQLSKDLEAGLGYSHFFINEGASPYNYENYRYFPYDDVRAHVNLKTGNSTFGIAVSYNTPLLTVRDIDYNATIGFHCFDATITWRAARQEFAFGLTLASR